MCSKEVKSALARLGTKGNAFQYQEIVDRLQQSVTTMEDIVIRYQGSELRTEEQRRYMIQLKDSVRDSKDLLEEVSNNTVRFPLFSNKIRKIKRLIKELKVSGENFTQSCSGNDPLLLARRREEETCSYVDEREIIGREADRETLVDMLLFPSDSDVSYVSIVGMGGLGKTTLAQLVFNDDRIRREFEFMIWVSVGEDSSFDKILTRIFESFEMKVSDIELPIDELQKGVGDKLQGKKFFLVLDDVWCEDRSTWILFKDFLNNVGASRGSPVLVTTRCYGVAQAIGDCRIHVLKGLSDDDSLNLFQRSAFSPHQKHDTKLVEIGKRIVKFCENVPLSIKKIASFLYGQEKSKWISFANANLVDKMHPESRILPSLRLSYLALPPELRNCFEFCSIFPKGYVIEKEVLISMWLALGYLVPNHDAQSMEDIGKDYCSKLFTRSFFRNAINDECGQVISFEMHDLIHELAQDVAGEDFLMLTDRRQLEKKFRHLSISEPASSIDLFDQRYVASKTLCTIFNLREYVPCSSKHVAAILSQCSLLRILDLRDVAIQALPDTFDQVPNLRYLDLSGNYKLEQLPTSISKLHRLQILRLRGCKSLEELPVNMGRLEELRTLDITGCDMLTSIPPGINQWSCLHLFTLSVVGGDKFYYGNRGKVLQMKELENLNGTILIEVERISSCDITDAKEGAYIVTDAHLHALECTGRSSDQDDVHETLLEIKGYFGTKLTSITLTHSGGLQHLTTLSQHRHLKKLRLFKLFDVESMEVGVPSTLTSRAMKSMIFFPSLEKLVLEWMPKLKGWWRDLTWMKIEAGDGCFVDHNGFSVGEVILPTFPRLHDLTIRNCPSLTYFPPCPRVKQMVLKGVNEVFCMRGSAPPNLEAPESSNSRDLNLCLDKFIVYYNARVFDSLFGKSVVQSAADINLKYFSREENLQAAREGFQRCGSSVRHLSIDGFYKLKSLSGGGIEHLTDLQSLSIKECFVLDLEEFEVDGEEEEEGMPWKSLRSLSSLTLDDIPKMVNLPKAFQYLTALQSLHIKSCSNLEALGDCVQFLTSLQYLRIEDCINLKTLPECLNSPMFQHIIPNIKNCPQLGMLHPNQEISVSE